MTTSQFKLKLTGIHFALCALVATLLFLGIWFVWYPERLFIAVGGVEIFAMIVAIDLIIGPLLTFVVAKPNKPSLRFDLAVIGLLQITALAYGCFALWAGRPVFIASLGSRFDVVTQNDIPESNLEGHEMPIWGPKWVSIKKPEDAKERDIVFMSALMGADYGHFPKYHTGFLRESKERVEKSAPISELKLLNVGREKEIAQWLESRKLDPEKVRFQALKARRQDMTVFLDEKGGVLGIAPFKPWKD
jgi:hypothetical protein